VSSGLGVFSGIWPLQEIAHLEPRLTRWGCLEVLGCCWVLILLARRWGGGGEHQTYHPILSSKKVLIVLFQKAKRNCRPEFYSCFRVLFQHVQLTGRTGCLYKQPWCSESSAGEWRLRKVSNAWDICSCSTCQAVLGGTVTSPYVIKAYHCHRQ